MGKIRVEVEKIPALEEDLLSLTELKNNVSKLAAMYNMITQDCLEFLRRAGTAESQEDEALFKTKTQKNREEIEQALAQIQAAQQLAGGHETMPERAQSIASTVSSSISRAMSKQRAKVEAAKARLAYAKKEAELRIQQAFLEVELTVLSYEKEVAAAEAEADALESA